MKQEDKRANPYGLTPISLPEKKNKEKKRKEIEKWAHNKFDGVKTSEEIERIISKTLEKYNK